MHELPRSWINVQLQEFGTWGSGGTPSKGNGAYYQGDVPWAVIGDLNDGLLTETANKISEAGLANSSAKLIPAETLLIAMYGSIGKLAITGIECCTNQAIAFCKIEDSIADKKYLFYALRWARPELVKLGQGASQQNISQTILKSFKVPLSPRAEQTRIAAKLDELLAQVDTLKARIDGIPALLKRFRQSVLAAAVSGRLTEEWRKQNLSQTDLHTSDANTSTGFAWPEVSLGDVAQDFSYGSSAKSKPNGDTPVLRMGNIQGGRLDWGDLVFSTDQQEIKKYALHPGDVLFNRTNSPELVGKTAIYKGERQAIYAGYLIRVRCSEQLNADFLNYCLNSPQGRHYCWQVKTDGVSQSNINAKKLAAFRFGLPSIEEQSEIVRRVEQLFAFADQLEARVKAAQAHIDRLTQSILAKAFRGELVPQDPNDEPASVLLERIKAQRAAAPKTKRGRRAATLS